MRRWLVLGFGLTLGACSDFTSLEGSGSTDTEPAGSDSTASSPDESTTTLSGTTSSSGGETLDATTNDSTTSPEATDTTAGPTGDPLDADTETETETSGREPSTGDSSTGEPPRSDCGDEVTQPGEACDDGNDDELDGCTSSCSIGPTALEFGPSTETDNGGGGSMQQINTSVDTCPDPQVLVGLSGGISSEGWLGVIRGECQDARLENTDPTTFRTSGPINELPSQGQFDKGGSWATQCADDEAIIAVRGGAGDVMDGLQIECAEVTTAGPPGAHTLEVSSTGWQPLQGGSGGGSFGPLRCPDGSLATGLETDTNSYVIRIRLLCRSVGLQYP